MAKKLILTKRQAEVLDALCELGETDLVAHKLKLSQRSVATYIIRALAANKHPNRLTLALARDRELRNQISGIK